MTLSAHDLVLTDDGTGWLSAAVIVLPRDIFAFNVKASVLEELAQSLGLPFHLTGQAYWYATVFDARSDALQELAAQDKVALRLHYPPNES